MAERLPVFEWYDAWILAAVVYASDGKEPVPLWRLKRRTSYRSGGVVGAGGNAANDQCILRDR